MPFDPQWPQNGQVVDADRFRQQFTGLKDLIDAIQGGGISSVVVDAVNTLPAGTPANVGLSLAGSVLHFTFDLPQGQEGPMGQQGPPFGGAVVDAVTTVDPSEPAAVGVSFDGTNVHFTFDIPRGNDGSPGQSGSDGGQGPPGEPFAQAVVDNVDTLSPGQPATVGVSFDGSNVRFNFGIPRGNDGSDGSPGPPGEVSQSQLDTALSSTSANTNSVTTLDTAFSDPDLESMRSKLNELIEALRR